MSKCTCLNTLNTFNDSLINQTDKTQNNFAVNKNVGVFCSIGEL